MRVLAINSKGRIVCGYASQFGNLPQALANAITKSRNWNKHEKRADMIVQSVLIYGNGVQHRQDI